MTRLLAIVVIPCGTFGAIIGTWVGTAALLDGDFKDAGACFAFVVYWSWGAVSAYKHEFKIPREERWMLCAKVRSELSTILAPDSAMTAAIDNVKAQYIVVRPPRHRPSVDSSFDAAVELETEHFTIWLLGKDGALKAWDVR